MIISAAAVLLVPASTSILSLYTHPRPLHPPSASTPILGTNSPILSLYIQLKPPCSSSASTSRLSLYTHPHLLHPSQASTSSLKFFFGVFFFLLVLFLYQCNVVSASVYLHIFARISHVKIVYSTLWLVEERKL